MPTRGHAQAQRQRMLRGRPLVVGVGRATVLLASSAAVSRAAGLISSVLAASALGASELGLFAYLAGTALLISSIGLLGFAPLVTREIARVESLLERQSLASFATAAVTCLLMGASLVFVGVAHPSVGGVVFGPQLTGDTVILIGGWAVSSGLNTLFGAVEIGHRLFGWVASQTACRAVLVGLGTAFGAYTFNTAFAAAAGAAAGEAVLAGSSASLLLGRGHLAMRRDALSLRRRRGFALGAAGGGLASLTIQGSMWVSQIILLRTPGGLTENGVFLLANRGSLLVTFLPTAIAAAALPHLAGSRLTSTQWRRQSGRLVVVCTGLAFALALPLGALTSMGVPLLGSAFASAGPAVIVMAGCGIVMSLNNVLSSIAVAAQQLRLWVLSDLALAIMLVVVAALLARDFGAVGLAIAFVSAYSVSCLVLVPGLRHGPASVVEREP